MKPGGADWVRELNDDMAAIIEEGCQKTGVLRASSGSDLVGMLRSGDVWAAPLVSTYACLRGTRLMTIRLSFITVTIILLTAAGLVGPKRPSGAETLPREAQDVPLLLVRRVGPLHTSLAPALRPFFQVS
jgi:hypothetical protein